MGLAGTLFAATAVFILVSCTKNWPTCASEEHARLISPDKVFEAVYDNMICEATPELLETRVLVKTVGEVRQRVAFRGTTAVNSSLDRKTKEPKLTMQWQDSSNLVVTTFPNVIVDQRLTSEGLPYVVVRQANAPNTAKTAVLLEGADDLAKLHQLLESTELRARTDEVANLFYANFGKPQFWPVLDALWNLDDGKFPHVNWSAIRQPIVRLTIAGLWGQWSCGKLRSPDNVQLAAQYVRTQISSSDIQTRLKAISDKRAGDGR